LPHVLRTSDDFRFATHARNVIGRYAMACLFAVSFGALAQSGTSTDLSSNTSGPVRLRQPSAMAPQIAASAPQSAASLPLVEAPPASRPGEFEAFVHRVTGNEDVKRFGADLIGTVDEAPGTDLSPLVPPDYLLSAGDEVVVTLWGSIDADLRLVLDRSGRVSIPRVGPVMLAGTRYADAADVIRRRVAQVFRNFDLSVSLGQLRGVRVYVTGFVARPGAYSVSSLSTVASALIRAGGPSSAGSFRQIQLRRGAQPPVTFDLYDFLLRGDRSGDRVVQAGDVIHIGPIGAQVAVIGSVNKPAIFEVMSGETIADVLQMAGGFTSVADRTRLAVERLGERRTVRITELVLPAASTATLADGDVLRAFSAVDVALPIQRQNKRIRVEGEVVRPGEYVLPPESSIADALRSAGGLTELAYLFGSEFNRESVRVRQQENYDRALRDLETEFARMTATRAGATGESVSATRRLLDRLSLVKPTGRIVLELQTESRELPDLALEDGDRLYVPPRPTTVGVFGSVFNAGSYLFADGRDLSDYLRLAGGPTKDADRRSTFVIRANGSVESARQGAGWFGEGSLTRSRALAGDTLFIPEDMDRTPFVQHAKDWAQILYQFGLGMAAIRTFRD
jgi:polysaccharide export outer membrane protein